MEAPDIRQMDSAQIEQIETAIKQVDSELAVLRAAIARLQDERKKLVNMLPSQSSTSSNTSPTSITASGPWLQTKGNSCHGGHRVGRGRCWTSHAVRFADNTILSYLINVVPSIQCCVSVISSGLRSAVRRRLTSGRTVVSVVRINSDIIGELTRHHCVHFYGSYAFRTSYR